MAGPLPYEATINPDVARGLGEGAQRLKGEQLQTLRQVPLEHIEGDPGNTIDPDRVDEYQKNGYAVQPELRTNDLNDPEQPGKYVINEGHHRILSDVRNGKDSILAWTPDEAEAEAVPSAEDAKADRIKELTQPNGTPSLQDAMKDIPGPMRKAAADANYRASQNGEPAADAGATYKAAARATKVEALGQHLMDAGFSPEELESFPPAKLKEGLSQRIKTLGLNKTGAISDQTISDTIAWMRRQAPKP